MKKIIKILLLIMITASVYSQETKDYTLQFKDRPYIPLENFKEMIRTHIKESPNFLQNIDSNFISEPNSKYYCILQFYDIPDSERREDLKDIGVNLFDYIHNFAYYASIPSDMDIKDLEEYNIRSISPIDPLRKIDPVLLQDTLPNWMLNDDGTIDVIVEFWEDVDMEFVKVELSNSLKIKFRTRAFSNSFILRIEMNKIAILSNNQFLKNIFPLKENLIPLNLKSRNSIKGNILYYGLNNSDLNGDGINIGIWDVGIVSNHYDFRGHFEVKDNGNEDAHSTHVAGTIVGAGIISIKHRGFAPKSKLFSYDFNSEDLNSEIQSSINNDQIVISNNSWGNAFTNCENHGKYDTRSVEIDNIVKINENFSTIFSAGNDGLYQFYPCWSKFKLLTSGRNSSKNCLTIGNIDIDNKLNWQSSVGPTKDGRIKPELVALGMHIKSTKNLFEYSDKYFSIRENENIDASGTSMSTPAVSGVVALLYQKYKLIHNNQLPVNALIKAVICNSADDLGNTGPDFMYGFGKVNARKAIKCLENGWYESGTLSNQNPNQNITLRNILSNSKKFKATLSLTDYAGNPDNTKSLISDLDLAVEAKVDGVWNIYYPWKLDPDNPSIKATTGIDNTNNIEQIEIEGNNIEILAVRVSAFSLPQGDQTFSVAYEFQPEEIVLTYPIGGEKIEKGQSCFIQWDYYGKKPIMFQLEYSTNSGSSWKLIKSYIDNDKRSYEWKPGFNSSKCRVRVLAVTKSVSSSSSLNDFTVFVRPTINTIESYDKNAIIKWSKAVGAASYKIMRLKDNNDWEYLSTTSNDNYYDNNLEPQKTYWYSLIALGENGIEGLRSVAKSVEVKGEKYIWQSTTINPMHLNYNSIKLKGDYAFIVGNNGTILKSTNKGQDWSQVQNDNNYNINEIHLPSEQIMYAVGSKGKILQSSDYGQSFSNSSLGDTKVFKGVFFASNSVGWVVGDGGLIYKTNDGGISWYSQDSKTTQNLESVYFISSNQGWVVGAGGTVLYTLDGGAEWTPQDSKTSNYLKCIGSYNDYHIYVVGDNGTFIKFDPSDNEWTLLNTGYGFLFNSIFIYSNEVWIVGSGGNIIHSTNYGNNWEQQTSSSTNSLNFIYMKDAMNGFVVGDNSTFLYIYSGIQKFSNPYTGGIGSGFSSSEYDFENGYCGYLGGIGSGFTNSPDEFPINYCGYLGGKGSGFASYPDSLPPIASAYVGGSGSGFDVSNNNFVINYTSYLGGTGSGFANSPKEFNNGYTAYLGGKGSGFDYSPKFYPYMIPVTLISPPNNSIDIAPGMGLKWFNPPETSLSRVQISRDATFATVNFEKYVVGDSIYVLTKLPDKVKLYWRVQNYGFGASSLWSEVWNFTTGTEYDSVRIAFKSGWNLVSSYVAPQTPDSLQYVTTDLNPNLVIMKNAAGKIYMSNSINQIGIWDVKQGYQAYLTKADTLQINGLVAVPEQTPVYLNNGWSIIPYLRNEPMSIITALASITDAGRLIIVKRNDGKIFMPGGINQIGNQLPGEGYQAYLNAKDTLIYPPNAIGRTSSSNQLDDFDSRIIKTDFENTGNNASLILDIDMADNTELAVMNSYNKIVGAGRVVDSRTAIVIWGDDESTNTIDGSIENQELRILNYDVNSGKYTEINNLDLTDVITGTKYNKLTYNKDAVLIGKVLTQPLTLKVNPNPFSNSTEVVYSLADDCEIELSLYNLSGMKVLDIANGKQTKGTHKLTINAENLSSGTYNLILKSCGKSVVEKVVVVK